MFKFNFSQVLDYPLDEEEDDESSLSQGHETIVIQREEPQDSVLQETCEWIALADLIKSLPSALSSTPLVIDVGNSKGNAIIIPRRDLYDARFQIISEEVCEDDETDEDVMEMEPPIIPSKDPTMIPLPGDRPDRLARLKDLEYIDAPSDVIPNKYEGGLKTWECSVDLVEYLSQRKEPSFRGKSILEVGCGTSVPSAFILQSLFNEDTPTSAAKTTLHLQDYNRSVLELVTVPNLLLAWYSSKASSKYRETLPSPPPDPTNAIELSIDKALVDAFMSSLKHHHIELDFSAGSWSTFMPRQLDDRPFDIILTSETIYRSSNVPSLLSVLRSASSRPPTSERTGLLALLGRGQVGPSSLILVAAKVLYFGVGGSVDEFEAYSRASGANVTTVHETNEGVGRRIMSLQFR